MIWLKKRYKERDLEFFSGDYLYVNARLFEGETGMASPARVASRERPNKQILLSQSSPPFQAPKMRSEQATEDTLNARIGNLEKRLESSDSVYRLNVQAQSLREKEGREKLSAIATSMKDLEKRVRTVESDMHYLDDVIQKIIQEEILSLTPRVLSRKSPEIEDKISRLQAVMTDGARETQGRFLSLTQKVIEIEAEGIDVIRERMAKLRENQEEMIDFLSTAV